MAAATAVGLAVGLSDRVGLGLQWTLPMLAATGLVAGGLNPRAIPGALLALALGVLLTHAIPTPEPSVTGTFAPAIAPAIAQRLEAAAAAAAVAVLAGGGGAIIGALAAKIVSTIRRGQGAASGTD